MIQQALEMISRENIEEFARMDTVSQHSPFIQR